MSIFQVIFGQENIEALGSWNSIKKSKFPLLKLEISLVNIKNPFRGLFFTLLCFFIKLIIAMQSWLWTK